LKIKRYDTATAVAAALKDGSLDMVVGAGVLAPADLIEFTDSGTFNVVMTPVLMHTLIIINSGKAPTDSIKLRKAIIHGVDKASIIQNEFGGIGEAVDRVFPRSAPYSNVELSPRWDYDSQKARLLNCPSPLDYSITVQDCGCNEVTNAPTKAPTAPTKAPTKAPTAPTLAPTKGPTRAPTQLVVSKTRRVNGWGAFALLVIPLWWL
jgi:hypothetical protein